MNYTIFDGHCDTPIELWRNQASLRENSSAISLSRAKTLGGYAQFLRSARHGSRTDCPTPSSIAAHWRTL